MATKFPKYLEKGLRKRYSNYPKKILVINGVSSDHRDKKELIPFLKEDIQYSKNRITRKRLERKTLLEEIKKDEQEIENINFLLEKLEK